MLTVTLSLKLEVEVEEIKKKLQNQGVNRRDIFCPEN